MSRPEAVGFGRHGVHFCRVDEVDTPLKGAIQNGVGVGFVAPTPPRFVGVKAHAMGVGFIAVHRLGSRQDHPAAGLGIGQIPQATRCTRGANTALTRPSTPFCSWIIRGSRRTQAAPSAGIEG